MRLLFAICVLAAVTGTWAACNTGLPNVTLPDNGNVCLTLAPLNTDPPTTCMTAISSGLNAALAACALDDNIIIELLPGFAETGPFVFPDVTRITLFGDGSALLQGSEHVVVGNHTWLVFDGVVYDGQGTTNRLFEPPLRSNNVTFHDSYVIHFHGNFTLQQEACENNTRLEVYRTYFFDNWGASLFAAGLGEYDIQSNTFAQCGGNVYGATFMKNNWVTRGTDVFFNNSQWVLFDELPPSCVSCVDPACHVRCNSQVLECEDITGTTIAGDCPTTVITFFDTNTNTTVNETVFEPFCRRYGPCQCELVIFNDLSNLTLGSVAFRVGDIIYPHFNLTCLNGSNLIAGGSAASVAPLNFTDPSFEAGNNPGPGLGWTTSSANVILQDPNGGNPPALLGTRRVMCNGGQAEWFEQTLNFTDIGNYVVSFWGARRDNQRNNFGNAFIELWIDGLQVPSSTISDPTFFNLLVADNTYYEFIVPPFTIGTIGLHTFRLRCNFLGTGNGLVFAIDNIFSRESGFQLVSFPPGFGLGPPQGADPFNYIALPLTSDAFIEPLPCPACPVAPPIPPQFPCVYTIATNYSCFQTIYNGDLMCVDPTLQNAGVGAIVADPSFENATFFWTQPLGQAVFLDSDPGVRYARTGTHVVYCDKNTEVQVEQTVTFPASAQYTLSFWGLRTQAKNHYDGKAITLLVDNVAATFITNPAIGLITTNNNDYFQFSFAPITVTAGPHLITVDINMNGGPDDAEFQLDDMQFVGAFGATSATPTPSLTPTPSFVPVNCSDPNVTTCINGTAPPAPNITTPSMNLVCNNSDVYLDGVMWTGGCIVPGNMMVPYNTSSTQTILITANECMTIYPNCTLPEMFDFILDGTEMTCVSLSLGIMGCDCSTNKLIGLYTNRTLTADACAYTWDETPLDVSGFFVRANRAQQLDFGGCSRRLNYDTVVASSEASPDWFDEKGVGREIARQNPQLFGKIPDPAQPQGFRQGPRFLMDALTVYREICTDNCPQANPTRIGSNIPSCLVDNAGCDFDSTVYCLIQDAIDNCPADSDGNVNIVIVNTENQYEENLVFSRARTLISSMTNATIIGVHELRGDVEVVFGRGCNWIHNGVNGQPQFDIDKADSLKNFTMYNNLFVGNGIKDGGIINNKNRRIDFVGFSYNMVVEFQTTVMRFTARTLVIEHNQVNQSSGRLFQVRYSGTVRVQHNNLINSRGGPEIQKPALVDIEFDGRPDIANSNCNVEPDACLVRRITQLETAQPADESPDYKETGVLLRKGSFFAQSMRDMAIIKARTGLRLRKVTIIASPEVLAQLGTTEFLSIFQFYNPLVRPTRFRREKNGEDFMIDGFFEGTRFGRITCSFPNCTDYSRQPKRCTANMNFDSYYSEQFGWETFNNATQASLYCPLDTINITVFGGNRLKPERLGIRRPNSNDIVHPLLNEPTYQDIMLGKAPVPNRFHIQGVTLTADDVVYFASLLAANNTYGFGSQQNTLLYTNAVCSCPAITFAGNVFGAPGTFVYNNCTTLVGPFAVDFCAVFESLDPTIIACAEGGIQCTSDGSFIIVGGVFQVFYFQCQVPVFISQNVTVGNSSSIVNSTVYVTQNQTLGDLSKCTFATQDVFNITFSESTLNLCVKPAFYAVGGTFLALNISWFNVDFFLDYGPTYEDSEINVPMLTNVDPSVDIRFRLVTFDGQNAPAPAPMQALALSTGLAAPDNLGKKQQNQRPAVFSTLLVTECVFKNFQFFETAFNNTNGSLPYQQEVAKFPYITALDVQCVNTLLYDPTEMEVSFCNFTSIDQTSVRLRFANYTRFLNNTGYLTGGRSLNTPAAYWMELNSQSVNSLLVFNGNNLTQLRQVTFPYLGDLTVPGFQSMVWVTGLRDDAFNTCIQGGLTIQQCINSVAPSCCPVLVMRDNFICGLPIGTRFVGEPDAITQYILEGLGIVAVPFGDKLTGLRELALANNVSIDGTVCDLMIGAPNNDWENLNLCCNEACPPGAPGACRVNSSDVSINPSNPWWDVYVFGDLNLALETCQAPSRQVNLENPSDNAPYEVRITANIMQPPVIVYKASFSGPVFITVLSTIPFGASSPPAVSIPISWTDATVPPFPVAIFPAQPPVLPTDITIKGSLQMPPNVPPLTPTQTPSGWFMDISISFTFCAPNNSVTPVPSFLFSFIPYTSPPINVNTPSFDYAATLVVSWDWLNGTAKLATTVGVTLNGVGLPEIQCNAHSVKGEFFTAKNVKFLHGDPCADLSINQTTCPCLLGGEATWLQPDARPAPSLLLTSNMWDGDGYAALAIDGEYWGSAVVSKSSFVDYRLQNPGYVVRMLGSPTENCCNNASCTSSLTVDDNTFIGQDSVAMTGCVVYLEFAEYERVASNTFFDVGCQDTVHPTPGIVYIRPCAGGGQTGTLILKDNDAQRTSGATVNGRIAPGDCLWTAYFLDGFPSSRTIERNVQVLTTPVQGAAVCLRVVDWPVNSPNSDCRRALRNLKGYPYANNLCDGVVFDISKSPCGGDLCDMYSDGCPIQPDPACNAATYPPCTAQDKCNWCNGTCSRTFDAPLWLIITAVVLAALLLILLLCCCGCCVWSCVWMWPLRIKSRKPPPGERPNLATANETDLLKEVRSTMNARQ